MRAETGPMRFVAPDGEEDWTGVFLRGDFAGPMAMLLSGALDYLETDKYDAITIAMLRGLADDLGSCDDRVGRDREGVQRAQLITDDEPRR